MNIQEEIKKLTPAERKIYETIMREFPATDPLSAIDKALQGGTNFQFIPK